MLLIIYLLACIGAHRLWNFEAVFQGPRDWLLRYRWAKPLTCQACNAFWIAAVLAVPYYFERAGWPILNLEVLAAYAVLRGILWVYRIASHWDTIWRIRAAPAAPALHTGSASGSLPAGIRMQPEHPSQPAPGCSDCETKKAAAVAAQSRALSFKRRVVLLTTLSGFPPSYSVASVICDQARMLAMDPTWFVQIWVNESANLALAPKDLPLNVEIVRCVPTVSRMDPDRWAAADADRIASTIRLNLMKLGNATVISHDLLFLRTHVAYAVAIHSLGEIRGFAWMHVCHSAAGNRVVVEGAGPRFTLPQGHKLLCLNPSQREPLARYYDTSPDNVLVCPNARDIVSWYDFHPIAAELTRQYELDRADIVQVFPVCATRLNPKGVAKVIDIFGELVRNHSKDCRLVLAVANAGGPRERAALAGLRTRALNLGMNPDRLIITSEDFPDTAVGGIPHRAIRDLFLVSNVFVFPSLSEASSLVLGEAALAGCLVVGNTELRETDNLLGVDQLRYDFGSLRQPLTGVKLDGVALDILRALGHSQANLSKRKILREFNFTTVGTTLRSLVEGLPLH